MSGAERRAAPRAVVALATTFQTDDGAVHRGTIENLSESGALVVAESGVPAESDVRILFDGGPDAGGGSAARAVELRGRIVRSSPLGEYGVVFVELGERAREAVRRGMTRGA